MSYEEEDYKPTLKLKALVEAFKNADLENDETEVFAVMKLLDDHKWNADFVKLKLKMDWVYDLELDDSQIFDDIMNIALRTMPEPNLSDNEKLDLIVDMSDSPVVHYDKSQVKAIAEVLKHDVIS